jgi:hypothetical protein
MQKAKEKRIGNEPEKVGQSFEKYGLSGMGDKNLYVFAASEAGGLEYENPRN